MQLVQIVPALPPDVNGLGDQAYLLALELRRKYAWQTQFIVTSRQASIPGNEMFPICLTEPNSPGLLKALRQIDGDDMVVLLHYVGYAYARRGCPFWLLEALKSWRQGQGRRLITMFYEIYASGPPWRSSFWTHGFQKSIAARLAGISDLCRTNMRQYAMTLERISDRKDVSVMPVFSNVGEGTEMKAFEQRKRRLVIFGGAAWRAAVYTHHLAELIRTFDILELDEVIDVGPPLGFRPSISIPFEQRGLASASEIGAILGDARVGVLCYPARYLAKSTIFAAYAAHAVAPLLLGDNGSTNEDRLTEGREYITHQLLPLDDRQIAAVSGAAYRWYADHDLHATADAYAEAIAGNTT